jgi:hypothetical protein
MVIGRLAGYCLVAAPKIASWLQFCLATVPVTSPVTTNIASKYSRTVRIQLACDSDGHRPGRPAGRKMELMPVQLPTSLSLRRCC